MFVTTKIRNRLNVIGEEITRYQVLLNNGYVMKGSYREVTLIGLLRDRQNERQNLERDLDHLTCTPPTPFFYDN